MKAKVLEILRTFSIEEIERFGEFVNSDYFNKSVITRKLYAELLKYTPAFSTADLIKENLFAAIYPEKKYNESRLLNLFSGLYKLSEDFIAQESFQGRSLEKEYALLCGINSRKLYKYFEKSFQRIQIELESKTLRDKEYFKKRQEIEYQNFAYLSNTNRMYFLNKQPIQSYLDKQLEYFVLENLINYSYLLNQKKYVVDLNYRMPFLEQILEYVKENALDDNPTISIYYNLILMLIHNDEKYYFIIKKLLKNYPDSLEKLERFNVYTNLLNFCISGWVNNSTNNKFTNEIFELYKKIITDGIYKYESTVLLEDTVYFNIVNSGLLVKQYKWVEEFINNFHKELQEENKDIVYNLCYAVYYFALKNHEKSLEYLNRADRKKIYFNIKINTLVLKNYYEMDHWENAFSAIDSYKHFLKNNKEITPNDKIWENNFTNDLNNLLKAKMGMKNLNKTDFNFHKDIRNTSNARWLLEKYEELNKA